MYGNFFDNLQELFYSFSVVSFFFSHKETHWNQDWNHSRNFSILLSQYWACHLQCGNIHGGVSSNILFYYELRKHFNPLPSDKKSIRYIT